MRETGTEYRETRGREREYASRERDSIDRSFIDRESIIKGVPTGGTKLVAVGVVVPVVACVCVGCSFVVRGLLLVRCARSSFRLRVFSFSFPPLFFCFCFLFRSTSALWHRLLQVVVWTRLKWSRMGSEGKNGC